MFGLALHVILYEHLGLVLGRLVERLGSARDWALVMMGEATPGRERCRQRSSMRGDDGGVGGGMARAVAAMIALLSSFVVVALAEMGDKTQLIALILGLRYRRPWIVMTGILIATVCNHALAAAVGVWGAARFDERVLGLVLGVSFIAFGLWTLVPDRAAAAAESHAWGPLVSTTLVFFFAEMGDKTQLATLALGARFGSPVLVTAGTTAGMLVADGVAVFAGSHFGERVPMALFRRLAAALFFVFGILSLASAVGWL